MKVIAKNLGEYPQGIWRQPGEAFEFNGKEPAKWMGYADKMEQESNAEKLKRAKSAYDNAKFTFESAEATYNALKKKFGDELKENNGKSDDDKPKEFYAIHRGAGKWYVFGADKNVVENGGDLNKADAAALVKQLLADKAEA